MRQKNVDWQIWLREGADPLPCKIVITSRIDPSMPQYEALLTWVPVKSFPASTFTLKPPPGAGSITIGKLAGNSAPAKGVTGQ
ncbi:hypothetical protein GCM10011529_00090 [Polymorphobacter glacialis]|uniref:Uncharacterized protein n=1 Tax=Sandarakinorhabdus glacialis TaxID=1614636 RepID=A0A916ZI58_9SPHN|nr:DUF2092 domain-containing protein [Polymorphobacter glacialis]GGD98062.1 hypothetical protein GCM10011529_00090 [Polymorphobacter glacialis]